jgi:hypothetical protein
MNVMATPRPTPPRPTAAKEEAATTGHVPAGAVPPTSRETPYDHSTPPAAKPEGDRHSKPDSNRQSKPEGERQSKPDSNGRATSFLERVPLRRRLRFLRRARELALRDLGGFVYEAHRQGQPRPALLSEKLDALDALDGECQKLGQALDEREEVRVLREPGISACPHCSTIYGSEARFCPGCGVPTRANHASGTNHHATDEAVPGSVRPSANEAAER